MLRILLTLAVIAPTLFAQSRGSAAPAIAETRDSVIVLSNGQQWKPGLYQIKLVYTLQVPGGVPFFVLSGVACLDCDAELNLLVLRPSEVVQWTDTMIGFAYPGPHTQMMSDSVDALRRQFFGHCLKDEQSTAVQIAHEQHRDGAWRDSIRTLVATRNALVRHNYAWTIPRARETLDLARTGQCHEWKPR